MALSDAFPLGKIGDNKPEIVYHYTSLETMMKIVDSQQLWATNVKFLNDTAERTAFLSRALARMDGFRAANPGLNDLAFSELSDPSWPEAKELRELPSVISFSHDGDSLPQWRSYSPKGRGIALGFAVSSLTRASVQQEIDLSFPNSSPFRPPVKYGPVSYLQKLGQVQVDAGIRSAYEVAESEDQMQREDGGPGIPIELNFRFELEDLATFHKDASFQSEQEYRLVVSAVYTNLYLLHYRTNDWSMIPYLKVDIPNTDGIFARTANEKRVHIHPAAPYVKWDAIKEVCIGPTADKSLTAEVVESYFESKRMTVKVRTTDIPFRDW